MSKILIIDDENDICFLISEILNDEKFICKTANNSTDALIKFNNFNPDLIILDVWLSNSELDGIELLEKFKNLNPLIPVIIISGHGNVNMAVNAIKKGAYDFLEKPFNSEKLIITSKRALQSATLIKENNKLKSLVTPIIPLIGNSNFVLQLKKNIIKIAQSNSRVFINGPFGSGKKLIGQLIHQHSIFSKNLSSIIDFKTSSEEDINKLLSDLPQDLDKNIIVQSNNNTLILDNIDSLNINSQKKLLFFLENNQFYKKNYITLKQKIIALTSKDILNEINQGNFLQSLYERLSVIDISVPSISLRRDDIIPICEFYLNFYKKNEKITLTFSDNAKSKLELYDWPGNIAQIINYAEKTIILNQNLKNKGHFEVENLPLDMGDYSQLNLNNNNNELNLKEARNKFEKDYLLSQIKRFNGNIKKISDFTGMERTALYRKFKSLNINVNKN